MTLTLWLAAKLQSSHKSLLTPWCCHCSGQISFQEQHSFLHTRPTAATSLHIPAYFQCDCCWSLVALTLVTDTIILSLQWADQPIQAAQLQGTATRDCTAGTSMHAAQHLARTNGDVSAVLRTCFPINKYIGIILSLQWADQSPGAAQLQGAAPHEPEGGVCCQAGTPTIAF